MSIELRFDRHNIKVYKGDNQEVLESLRSKSLKLIYCDILYNSGKDFDDYNDNLGSPLEAVEWYRPRFKEMYRTLEDNGSIYIHCNWRLDSYMRILLDEIFGIQNFRSAIHRKHSEERGFVENYDSQMDTILYYVKDKNNFVFNEVYGDKLNIVPLVENGLFGSRSDAYHPVEGTYYWPKRYNKHWLISSDKYKELALKGEIVFIDELPYRKTYAIPVGNLWNEKEMLDNYSRTDAAESYDTPKPPAVLDRIIEVSSNEGDTVGDFFMGGGTTPVEAFKKGRKSVSCDISEKACNVTIGKLTEEMGV